ncbi:MAG TPA: hypothetical protein VNG71_13950 [Pyrinomonadaceae bacterium]|nr:hypothetical protein [Pyrinomonadaceae bacterium]
MKRLMTVALVFMLWPSLAQAQLSQRSRTVRAVGALQAIGLTVSERQAGRSKQLIVQAATGQAEKAGIKRGDIIAGIQGVQTFAPLILSNLNFLVEQRAGKPITFELVRGRKPFKATIKRPT